jgi:hypothetical protein
VDNRKHFAHKFRVKGGGLFVKKQGYGIHGKSPGDGDTLFLPAGKFRRIQVWPV